MTVDLTDAERYREAYHKVLDEVGVLAARNQLAESEANRLSQFNAEILAHNNPAQRIVYLDRVRRELAETKQVRFFYSFCRISGLGGHVTALVALACCTPNVHTVVPTHTTWFLIPFFFLYRC